MIHRARRSSGHVPLFHQWPRSPQAAATRNGCSGRSVSSFLRRNGVISRTFISHFRSVLTQKIQKLIARSRIMCLNPNLGHFLRITVSFQSIGGHVTGFDQSERRIWRRVYKKGRALGGGHDAKSRRRRKDFSQILIRRIPWTPDSIRPG